MKIVFLMLTVAGMGGTALAAQTPTSPHGPLPDSLDCVSCHTPERWSPVRPAMDFDHQATAFPLTGRHAEAACATCHLNLRFDEPSADEATCVTCHLDVHQGSLSEDCVSCHTTESFTDVAGVEVHANTTFPLTGAHLQVSCESCHVDDAAGAFSPLPTDCIACHQDDFERTASTSIDHQASGFPTQCNQCHTDLMWTGGAEFDHVDVSGGFELLGAHARTPCASCHVVPGFTTIYPTSDQNDCIACHQNDYNQEHGGSGFPTTCTTCHTVENWDADFDHVVVARGFELLGAHDRIPCESCHIVPGFASKYPASDQNDCIACHQDDYNRQHAGSGFPTTCTTCHTVENWDSDFDHVVVARGFDLLGAHNRIPCESCHIVPGFASKYPTNDQNDCIACHQDDYNREHAGTGFPTTCLNCHTVNNWNADNFDHDGLYFPIYSGPHKNTWADCATCHTVIGDFSAFTCFNCHEHNRTRMDSKHRGVSGYTYQSQACLSCHPNGKN